MYLLKILAIAGFMLLPLGTAFALEKPQSSRFFRKNTPTQFFSDERQQESYAHFVTDSRYAQHVKQCIKNAGGEKSVDDLKSLSDAHRSKISKLCEDGKRDIAQTYARDVATELQRDPRMVELQKCPANVLKKAPVLNDLTKPSGTQPNHHICDK